MTPATAVRTQDRINTIVIDLDQGLVTIVGHREYLNASGGVEHRARLSIGHGLPSVGDDRELVEAVNAFILEHIAPRVQGVIDNGGEIADIVKNFTARTAPAAAAKPLDDDAGPAAE